MARVLVQLDVNRRGQVPKLLKDAGLKFYNVNLKDAVRQVEGAKETEVIESMRSGINRAISVEIQRMKQVLVGTAGIIGSGIGRDFKIQPGEGTSHFGKASRTPYDFTSVVGWKAYSPGYSKFKKKKHRANWKRWFLATGELRNELRASKIWSAGEGLGSSIKVIIRKRGSLTDGKIAELGRELSTAQRGRPERLQLFDIKLRIFANLTSAELPYLSSGSITDVNSRGAILGKLGLESSIQEKMIPHSLRDGKPRTDLYRPVFEPLLTYFMSQRIPAAVSRAIYEPGGRGNKYGSRSPQTRF